MTNTPGWLVGTVNRGEGRAVGAEALARRAKYVAQFRRSGLTMAAFARREGLAYSSFASWVLRHARQDRRPSPAVRFAEVAWPTAGSAAGAGLEVRLPDGTVLRGERVDALAALARTLKE